jgi:hypothetical protein
MGLLDEKINALATDVSNTRQSLDDVLFALQTWLERTVDKMSDAERAAFSDTVNAEKDTATHDGKPHGDDNTLASSVLRLHAMRLLYRFDEARRNPPTVADNSAYTRAKLRLQQSLRQVELAMNEARVDTAIANAHNILNDAGANRRWLQDALSRLKNVANKDLLSLADAIPMPEMPPLNLFQRVIFRLFGIKQEEIARRSLKSLRQIAEMETSQMVELARLLADSFTSIGDSAGGQQALALLSQLRTQS